MMEKPDVDSIDGLSPGDLDRPEDDVAATRARPSARSPRSTTTCACSTRAIGKPHCPVCGRPIAGQTLGGDRRPDPAAPRGDEVHGQRAGRARPQGRVSATSSRSCGRKGFTRVKVDGEQQLLEEPTDARQEVQAHDRGGRRPARDEAGPAARGSRSRSRPQRQLADGLVVDRRARRRATHVLSENFACPEHGVWLPELEPRIFSLQLAARRLPALHRPRRRSRRSTPTCSCPTRRSRSARARSSPGRSATRASTSPSSRRSPTATRSTSRRRGRTSTRSSRTSSSSAPNGDQVYVQYRNRMGRKRSYMLAFEGIVASLERRYRETDSSQQRERIEEYMSFRPCPVCHGARLKPEVLAVTVGGAEHPRVHAACRCSGRSSSSTGST